MRPLSGSSRMDVGSTTSPTLASVVRNTSLPAVTFTPSATLPILSAISNASFWPTSSRNVCLATAKPDASIFNS